ncbi:MAG: hypothetical protein ACRD6X_15885 [Pyrinomonadaceae bacterium]
MDERFRPGDFLFFQLEAGFALLRLIGVDRRDESTLWHISAYDDLFDSPESIEAAIVEPEMLNVAIPHAVLTDRAFNSTQVATIGNRSVTDVENKLIDRWRANPDRKISDRSIRLLLGFR